MTTPSTQTPQQALEDLKANIRVAGSTIALTLITQLQDLVDGAEADVRVYATAIATDIQRAASLPTERQTAVINECIAQAPLLLEINRLRVNAAKQEAFNAVIFTAINIGVAAMTSGMGILAQSVATAGTAAVTKMAHGTSNDINNA